MNNGIFTTTSMSSSVAPTTKATLTWKSLTVKTSTRNTQSSRGRKDGLQKVLLRDVNGFVLPGQLVALMGSSGAGKTTLLNSLLGRNVKGLTVEGEVMLNGKPTTGGQLTAVSGYVQQDDLFIGSLTVEEHLTFQATMRLDHKLHSAKERTKKAADAMRDIGLNHCRNTVIGIPGVIKGLSGGERKRLAFASEMLTSPSILFCDEPTTGLDSHLADNVIKALQAQTNRGMAIVCTIHQPASEVYDRFDRLLLLASGKVAYFGNAGPEPVSFFNSVDQICPTDYNPADFFITALVDDKVGSEIVEFYGQSDYSKTVNETIEQTNLESANYQERTAKIVKHTTPFWVQFCAILLRCLTANYRDKKFWGIKTFQKVVMGFFVGLLYFQVPLTMENATSISGSLFFTVQHLSYPALFAVLNHLPADFPLIVREYHDGLYSLSIYYVARNNFRTQAQLAKAALQRILETV